MKKTLLALAVVAAAGSVNAAELMNTGTVSVTTDADFEVSLVGGPFADDPNFSYDGAEIAFGAESVINDNWTAFLNYGLEMEYAGDVVPTDIVAGFKFYNNHLIEFGQTSHVLDLGNNQSKELGVDISNDELPSVDDIIVYKFTGEQFGFGASIDLEAIEGADKSGYAFYADGTFGGLNVRGDIGFGDETVAATKPTGSFDPATGLPIVTPGTAAYDQDYLVYGVKATYTMDAFSVGGSYVGSSLETDAADAEVSLYDIWVGFSAGLDWYLGYQGASATKDGSEDGNAYVVYLNTSYQLNDVVGFYAEIGMADIDNPDGLAADAALVDDGFGYAIGMTMSF